MMLSFLIVGCDFDGYPCKTDLDKEKDRKFFIECLEKTKINNNVHYNDTDEMIDSCSSAANYSFGHSSGTQIGDVCYSNKRKVRR